jgi:hypothetical protein
MVMSVDKSVELMAEETDVLGDNLSQCRVTWVVVLLATRAALEIALQTDFVAFRVW